MALKKFNANTTIVGRVGVVDASGYANAQTAASKAATLGLNQISEFAEKNLTKQRIIEGADAAAKTALQRGADGNLILPEADGIHETFTIFGDAYRTAITEKYKTTVNSDIRRNLNKLYVENLEDPAKFREASGNYINTTLNGVDSAVYNDVQKTATTIGNQYALKLDNAQATRVIEDNKLVQKQQMRQNVIEATNLELTPENADDFRESTDRILQEMANSSYYLLRPGKLQEDINNIYKAQQINYGRTLLLKETSLLERKKMIDAFSRKEGKLANSFFKGKFTEDERQLIVADFETVDARLKALDAEAITAARILGQNQIVKLKVNELLKGNPELESVWANLQAGNTEWLNDHPSLRAKFNLELYNILVGQQDDDLIKATFSIVYRDLSSEQQKLFDKKYPDIADMRTRLSLLQSFQKSQSLLERKVKAAENVKQTLKYARDYLSEKAIEKLTIDYNKLPPTMNRTDAANWLLTETGRAIVLQNTTDAQDVSDRINGDILASRMRHTQALGIAFPMVEQSIARGDSPEDTLKIWTAVFQNHQRKHAANIATYKKIKDFNKVLKQETTIVPSTPSNIKEARPNFARIYDAEKDAIDSNAEPGQDDPVPGEYDELKFMKRFGIVPVEVTNQLNNVILSGDDEQVKTLLQTFDTLYSNSATRVSLISTMPSKTFNAWEKLSNAGTSNPSNIANASSLAQGGQPLSTISKSYHGAGKAEKLRNFNTDVVEIIQAMTDTKPNVVAKYVKKFSGFGNTGLGSISSGFEVDADALRAAAENTGVVFTAGIINEMPDGFFKAVKDNFEMNAFLETNVDDNGPSESDAKNQLQLSVIRVLSSGRWGATKIGNPNITDKAIMVENPLEYKYMDNNKEIQWLVNAVDAHVQRHADTQYMGNMSPKNLSLSKNLYLRYAREENGEPVYQVMTRTTVDGMTSTTYVKAKSPSSEERSGKIEITGKELDSMLFSHNQELQRIEQSRVSQELLSNTAAAIKKADTSQKRDVVEQAREVKTKGISPDFQKGRVGRTGFTSDMYYNINNREQQRMATPYSTVQGLASESVGGYPQRFMDSVFGTEKGGGDQVIVELEDWFNSIWPKGSTYKAFSSQKKTE